MNLSNYSFEITPIETSAGGILFTLIIMYLENVVNLVIYMIIYNDISILLLLKLTTQENKVLLWELFTDIHLWTSLHCL